MKTKVTAKLNTQYAFASQRGYYPDALDKPNQDSCTILPAFMGDAAKIGSDSVSIGRKGACEEIWSSSAHHGSTRGYCSCPRQLGSKFERPGGRGR
ncbi:hypothetical protein KRP22_014127 [Phytophthora ramorum]|nr:hypothetical protein KRP22_9274 [Phytophthora ramorum]